MTFQCNTQQLANKNHTTLYLYGTWKVSQNYGGLGENTAWYTLLVPSEFSEKKDTHNILKNGVSHTTWHPEDITKCWDLREKRHGEYSRCLTGF